MNAISPGYRSRWATVIFDLLDPIPYGLFVGTLIFDILYAVTANVFWAKGAAWLVTVGLLFAIIPRLINLGHVWITSRSTVTRLQKFDFWLNLLGIIAAIANAFVHSRDAYGIVPENVLFSVITVLLLSVGQMALALGKFRYRETAHD